MREWRKEDLLGVFLDIINYINTPKQWSIFEDCQCEAVNNMPLGTAAATAVSHSSLVLSVRTVTTTASSAKLSFSRLSMRTPLIISAGLHNLTSRLRLEVTDWLMYRGE